MAKRRKVIHVATGRIFNTAAEAEREFGLPNSVLSEAIRLGRPCHGEVFKFVDEDNNVDNIEDDFVDVSPSVTSKRIDPVPTKYDGSPTDKRAASEYFNSLGFETEVVSGIVQFYNADFREVRDAVKESGYNASWGCMIRATYKEEPEEEVDE